MPLIPITKVIFKNSTQYFEFRRDARLRGVCVAYINVLATKHKLKRQSGKLKIPFAGNRGGGLINYPSLTG
jgi:hypothetical protein